MGVLELSADTMATGYPSFRAFMESRYAMLRTEESAWEERAEVDGPE